jgi:hypothetical protein
MFAERSVWSNAEHACVLDLWALVRGEDLEEIWKSEGAR